MYNDVKPGKIWYLIIALVFLGSIVSGSIFISQGFQAFTSIDTKEIGDEYNVEVLDDKRFQFYLDLQSGDLISVDIDGSDIEVAVDHAGMLENEVYTFTIEYQGSEEKTFTVYESDLSTQINEIDLVFSIEFDEPGLYKVYSQSLSGEQNVKYSVTQLSFSEIFGKFIGGFFIIGIFSFICFIALVVVIILRVNNKKKITAELNKAVDKGINENYFE